MDSDRFRWLATCAILFAIPIAWAGWVSVGSATTVAGTSVSSFELVLDGRHVPATIPSASGVMHVGTFTASVPFCASGTMVDLAFEGSVAVRRSYTCGDGTGSMSMRVTRPAFEHFTGGDGSWQILGGTGQYASLRGKGTYTSVHLGGDPADWGTVTFRSTSSGIADLDADAPQIVVARSSATKLRRPVGVYLVRLSFSARDNVEGNVASYQVTIKAGATDLAFQTRRHRGRNGVPDAAGPAAERIAAHPNRHHRIRPARQRTEARTVAHASAVAARSNRKETPAKRGKPTRGLEPRTPSLRVIAGTGSGVALGSTKWPFCRDFWARKSPAQT